jgi:hypothetical protein
MDPTKQKTEIEICNQVTGEPLYTEITIYGETVGEIVGWHFWVDSDLRTIRRMSRATKAIRFAAARRDAQRLAESIGSCVGINGVGYTVLNQALPACTC